MINEFREGGYLLLRISKICLSLLMNGFRDKIIPKYVRD